MAANDTGVPKARVTPGTPAGPKLEQVPAADSQGVHLWTGDGRQVQHGCLSHIFACKQAWGRLKDDVIAGLACVPVGSTRCCATTQ